MKKEDHPYRLNKEIFVERSNIKHKWKYNYTDADYKNQRTKVCIICPIHGKFWQTPKNHMKGQGCPLCGKKYAQEWQQGDYKHFIDASKKRFGDRYEFPKIEEEYKNSHSKITIKCTKCGNSFVKIACDHITSSHGGCMHCYFAQSKSEEEISSYLKKFINVDDIILNDRSLLGKLELDIYLPKEKIAIEYDGLFWHSDYNKDKNYHLMKTEACEAQGIQLIHIFEDEYIDHPKIVLNKLKHLIGIDTSPKIYARNCTVDEIDYTMASSFLDANHIQGHDKATMYIGAFFKTKLIGVMAFIKQDGDKWILSRLATDINYRIIGICSKLLKYFIKKESPSEIKSFADRRWTSTIKPNLYEKMGFKKEKILKPNYRYFFNGDVKRYHKFGFRKKILSKKYGLDSTLTESQMAQKIGVRKIWDCGLIKYIWKPTND